MTKELGWMYALWNWNAAKKLQNQIVAHAFQAFEWDFVSLIQLVSIAIWILCKNVFFKRNPFLAKMFLFQDP